MPADVQKETSAREQLMEESGKYRSVKRGPLSQRVIESTKTPQNSKWLSSGVKQAKYLMNANKYGVQKQKQIKCYSREAVPGTS